MITGTDEAGIIPGDIVLSVNDRPTKLPGDLIGILNIKKPYAALDKFTKQDHDRNAFSQKLQSTYYNIFCRSGFGYNFCYQKL